MKAELTEKMDNRQNEVKAVFLGDGDAGKSLIIERLMHDGAIPADYDGISTPGIAIRKKQYDLDGRRIQVNFWDFGGQEILHSMHRIFMTSRALYVVVLNARDDMIEDRTRYWLQNIRSFAGDAPVILVLNKNDQNPNAKININALHQQFGNLKRYVSMSALNMGDRTFNSEFTAMLLEEIQKTGFLDVFWPTPWRRLKQTLENMNGAYIQGDIYKMLCRDAGVENNQKELLHWFNDLGISFCFVDEGDYELSDHIVLRPDWIINALYIILFNKREDAQNGLIPHRAIYELLKNAHRNPAIHSTLPDMRYTSGDVQYVLGVMRKFNLSFPYGTEHEFFPMLCQQNSTLDIYGYEKDADTLEFQMEFDYLPNNLLHQLMVERYTELDIDNVCRTGARFMLSETGLSAVVVIDGNALRFLIRSTDEMHRPNTYLTMLKANVERIVKKMGFPEPDKWLVYKAEGKRDKFEYEMLMAMMEEGQSAAYSRVLRRMIPISDIVHETHIQSGEEKKKLLADLTRACMEIQSYRSLWNAREEERSWFIRDNLVNRGHIVRDQSRGGVFGRLSEKRAGELDLTIYKRDHQPWAACETLTVRGPGDIRNWNDHLTKMLTNYNASGLPVLFLVSFVECSTAEYYKLWAAYNKHMREYNPRLARRMSQYQHVLPLEEMTEYIRVAQCAYDIGGFAVTVYHYFVHMGEELSGAQMHDRLEMATAEIAELQGTLTRLRKESDAAQSRIAELSQMESRAVRYAAEVAALKAEQEQLMQDHNQMRDDCQQSRMMLEEARYTAQRAGEERDRAVARSEKQAVEIAKLHEDLEKIIQEQRAGKTNEQKATEITELMARLEQRQLELKETEAAVQAAMQKQKKLEELTQALEQQHLQLQKAQEAAGLAIKKQRELECQYAASQKHQVEVQKSILQARSENAALAERVAEYTKQIQKLEQELQTAQSKLEDDTDEDIAEEQEVESAAPISKEYRVIILGDSEAGKSQILDRLRHFGRISKTFSGDATPGIDIASRCLPIGTDRVRVNFWDFGGQEILHSMHRLFLAKNTMYLIVLNTRNNNQDEQAQFWLHYVELYATGAPTVLVLNKIDQNQTAELNMPVLRRMFQYTADILGVLRLSARDWSKEKFQQEFVKKLCDYIELVIDDSNKFSEVELQICDQMQTQNAEQQIVDMAEFKKLCKKSSLPADTDPVKLAERFHKAGKLVYFGTRSNMITNPAWITDAIYKILELGAPYASNGVIDYEKIEDILYEVSENYTKSHVDFVMKVMRKYGLSFQYQQQQGELHEQEFIPVLCRREEPEFVGDFIDNPDVIQMQIVFRYLPAGVLYQLMVDLKEDMKKHRQNAWLSGAMFEDNKGCIAVAIREKDRMTLYVKGEDRVLTLRYLEILRGKVEGIARGDMYHAEVQEALLGYHVSGQVEFFDYDRLSLSKEHNLNYIMSKRKPGAVSVQDILDQEDRSREKKTGELLGKAAVACTQLKQRAAFVDHQEDVRNSCLLDALKNMGYDITDQTFAGEAPSGNRQNELDLLVRDENGAPWMILEALNVSGKTGKDYWNMHLNKLMGRYNVWALRTLVLISYVDCEEGKFKTLYTKFRSHMEAYKPEEAEILTDSFDTYRPLAGEDNLFCADKCGYLWKGMPVTVYHYFVHMSEKPPVEEQTEGHKEDTAQSH